MTNAEQAVLLSSMTNAEKSVLFSDAAMRVKTARFKGILWRAAFVAALAADAETVKANEPLRGKK